MERRRIEIPTESPADIVTSQLRERIIGQDDAIEAIGTAYDKARLRQPGRPVASLMLLGPTGTGKTELAKSLSDIMAVDKLNPPFLRIDGGQYQHHHTVLNLTGAPKSYVGYGDPPVLDKETIEQPGSVILFDEIEKAHPAVWRLLLQIMEGDGVKLSKGEHVDFSNTTLLMTSNVGAREMDEMVNEKRIGFVTHQPQNIETVALGALRRQFAPEFINRLDAAITFNSLDDGQLSEVLQAHVTRSNPRYERQGNFHLETSPALREHLVETAENRKEYNSRPVLRNYEREVETSLSRMVAAQKIGGYVIHAEWEDEVTFYEGDPLPTVNDILLELDEGGIIEFEPDEPMCEFDEPIDIDEVKKSKRGKGKK